MKNLFVCTKMLVLFAILMNLGCAEAERSAAMALDSAGSVSRTAKSKLWIEPSPTATPVRE